MILINQISNTSSFSRWNQHSICFVTKQMLIRGVSNIQTTINIKDQILIFIENQNRDSVCFGSCLF